MKRLARNFIFQFVAAFGITFLFCNWFIGKQTILPELRGQNLVASNRLQICPQNLNLEISKSSFSDSEYLIHYFGTTANSYENLSTIRCIEIQDELGACKYFQLNNQQKPALSGCESAELNDYFAATLSPGNYHIKITIKDLNSPAYFNGEKYLSITQQNDISQSDGMKFNSQKNNYRI